MIEIEIDGVKLTVPQNSMIIEAADKAGINIPRFCYHKKLPIAANCRMCLIEVEKVGKPLPACATPVSQGMRVFTKSARALEAQKAVMEFLLINHPLDCPICDQGGECELQDISMGYGGDFSRFTEGKRAVFDEDLGPLVASDMTRCIQCTRCVRFGQEIAGVRELGAIDRGEHMEIKTYVKHTLSSELSGNIIDLCPVGALTSKPFRFTARAWELNQTSAIAPHDAVGSNVYVHTRRGKVMRVVPHENEEVNETWISDRDRFSYLGIYHADRIEKPLIKVYGEWYESDWSSALDLVVTRLNEVIHQYGASEIAALASPSSTVEECYLLQKLWRGIGSSHIDHRIHQIDFTHQERDLIGFQHNLAEFEQKDAILLIGSNVHHEQPLVGHRLRKASLQGAKIMVINPVDFPMNFSTAVKVVTHPYHIINHLAGIIKALQQDDAVSLPTSFMQYFSQIKVDSLHTAIAKYLKESQKACVLLGEQVLNHPQSSLIRWLANCITKLVKGASCGELTFGANATGACLSGLLPHRGVGGQHLEMSGFDAQKMFAQALKSYLLMGIDPGLDCANPQQVMSSLQQAEFVVAISSFRSKHLLETAHVILPAATFTETSGTFVNGEGRWQSFAGSVAPLDGARPIWKILRVLGNFFNLQGFDYVSSEEVRDELLALIVKTSLSEVVEQPFVEQARLNSPQLTRIVEWPIYRVDALVRHSESLQKLPTQKVVGVYVNENTAKKLGFLTNDLVQVSQGSEYATLPIFIDLAIPDDCVLVPAGYEETAMLGEHCGEIHLSHV